DRLRHQPHPALGLDVPIDRDLSGPVTRTRSVERASEVDQAQLKSDRRAGVLGARETLGSLCTFRAAVTLAPTDAPRGGLPPPARIRWSCGCAPRASSA